MRALVVGARGAVGAAIAAELERLGHRVVRAGRTPAPGFVRLDLAASDGITQLSMLAAENDVVINASGVEDVRLATLTTPVVEISATSSYLADLAAHTEAGATICRGAGLAPGLSTLLIAALTREPADDIDLGVTLGAGEAHGAAAVEWTVGLIGADIYRPPESATSGSATSGSVTAGSGVPNLTTSRVLRGPDGRARRYLRADFPDHLLLADALGSDRGQRPVAPVRSYLALTDRVATWALGYAGRHPWCAPMVSRAPHIGSDRWELVAANRRSGHSRKVLGRGQSHATAVMAVLAAEALVARVSASGSQGAVTMADLLTLDAALARLGEQAR